MNVIQATLETNVIKVSKDDDCKNEEAKKGGMSMMIVISIMNT